MGSDMQGPSASQCHVLNFHTGRYIKLQQTLRLIGVVVFITGLSVLLAIQLRPPLLHPDTLSALPARLTALALELQPTAPPMQQAAAAGG